MYFVILFVVSLVSWIWMIAVLLKELFVRLCKFGNEVLSDEAFHVIMLVSCSVSVLIRIIDVGMAGSGGGCEYSLIGSRHRRASLINWFGRKGNLLWRKAGVGVVFWVWMNSYNSVCIEFFGINMA